MQIKLVNIGSDNGLQSSNTKRLPQNKMYLKPEDGVSSREETW